MKKNTKILIGVGAVIAAYLILKPKKAKGQTLTKEETPKTTKDCRRTIHNCGYSLSKTEIIQIPLDAKCESYSVYPPCAPRDTFSDDWVSGWNKKPVENNNIIADDFVVLDSSNMSLLRKELEASEKLQDLRNPMFVPLKELNLQNNNEVWVEDIWDEGNLAKLSLKGKIVGDINNDGIISEIERLKYSSLQKLNEQHTYDPLPIWNEDEWAFVRYPIDPSLNCSKMDTINGQLVGCADESKFPSFDVNNLVELQNNVLSDKTNGRQYYRVNEPFGATFIDIVKNPFGDNADTYGKYDENGKLLRTNKDTYEKVWEIKAHPPKVVKNEAYESIYREPIPSYIDTTGLKLVKDNDNQIIAENADYVLFIEPEGQSAVMGLYEYKLGVSSGANFRGVPNNVDDYFINGYGHYTKATIVGIYDKNSPLASIKTSSLDELQHPKAIFQDTNADHYTFTHAIIYRNSRLFNFFLLAYQFIFKIKKILIKKK
jgi:hypothetical protein